MENAELIPKLKTIRLFKNMDDSFFPKFIPFISMLHFNAGTKIIIEGETGRDMYILVKGLVRILRKTMSGDEYTAALLKDEYGVFFGEVGLLSEEKRSASVVAEQACEIAELKCDNFNRFLDTYPIEGVRLLRELAVSICQKLGKSNNDTIVLYEALVSEIGEAFL